MEQRLISISWLFSENVLLVLLKIVFDVDGSFKIIFCTGGANVPRTAHTSLVAIFILFIVESSIYPSITAEDFHFPCRLRLVELQNHLTKMLRIQYISYTNWKIYLLNKIFRFYIE